MTVPHRLPLAVAMLAVATGAAVVALAGRPRRTNSGSG